MVSLRDWLTTLRAREVFNGTVLIAKDGNMLFKGHYGCADVAGRIPLSDHSSFSLASVSKPFTALGIMLLAQAGKLALDDPLREALPELASYDADHHRHLLHHTSGMPDYMALADRIGTARPSLDHDGHDLALFANHQAARLFCARDRVRIQQHRLCLLGEVDRPRVGDVLSERFMAEAIFKPLGMNDSAAFNLTSKELPAARAGVSACAEGSAALVSMCCCDLNYLDGSLRRRRHLCQRRGSGSLGLRRFATAR